jgi:signal transduction histidine kinase
MALGVWLILRKINKHLARPVAQVAYCSTGEPQPLPEHIKKSKWLEGRTLQENYEVMVKEYHSAKAEVRQLRTALDYAQNAETKRREMISNITHELKTPLAIIHSYAEGLKDGIAADRQDQYLNVIVEEAERMDGMVLEMLDLSRLEAGKVRLSSDRFSLLGLTRSIFDRLAPMAAEKDLQIQFYIVEEFEITADESRIGQVITNFATNAIKYTPEGGNIWIKVYRYRNQAILCIENECQPLPNEALSKVWDSFYRAETSRTTRGTGLGLTIAKAIIELHGGAVGAQNTGNGVEFRFTLP